MEISMNNTNTNQGSARIYQFPAGGRSALGGRVRQEFKPVTDQTSARVNTASCADSWYHEAAIREAEHSRDH
jgi:hypothetical protein